MKEALTAMKRTLYAPPAGTVTVSRRIGFAAPSACVGFIIMSEDETSIATRTIWYLCP